MHLTFTCDYDSKPHAHSLPLQKENIVIGSNWILFWPFLASVQKQFVNYLGKKEKDICLRTEMLGIGKNLVQRWCLLEHPLSWLNMKIEMEISIHPYALERYFQFTAVFSMFLSIPAQDLKLYILYWGLSH